MYYADAMNDTAGSKATRDCSLILRGLGYRHFDVAIYRGKSRFENLLNLLKNVIQLYSIAKPGDVVLFQYPLLGINKWLRYLVWMLVFKGCRTICLLHDLDSLRQVHHAWTLEQELSRLNAFNLVIAHNRRMKVLLQDNGLRVELRTLGLFDYLLPEDLRKVLEEHQAGEIAAESPPPYQRVAFAGNLGKSVFLKKLDQVQGASFILYGPGYRELPSSPWMEWAGSFNADELPLKLHADFGLIWDGDAIDACCGHLGTYLQYNNPHKASLYLLAGLPLIAPKASAIADFIEQHGVGITIDSLHELPTRLQQLAALDYRRMKAAAVPLAKALASGTFLKQALSDG